MELRAVAIAVGGVMVLSWQDAAVAQAPARTFALDLPPQDFAESLIAIGLRGDLTLGNVAVCKGRGPALRGTFTSDQALSALLRNAPCRFEFVARDTVRFTSRPAPAPPKAVETPRQPPASAPAAPLNQVEVTAQKRPEYLLKTAGGLHVLAAARLDAANSVDMTDVSEQMSALTVTNLGPGRDKLVLRGVSDGAFTGRARTTVASYLDDAPTTYNAPDPDLVLVDVDRVEALEGPQGALYGGGSIGGVLRIVTKRPDLSRSTAALQIRGAETERGADGWGAQATVNLPLVHNRLGLRLNLYDIEDGGYLQDQQLKSSNVDRTDRVGGRLALEAKPSAPWTILLSGAVQHLVTADTQYTTLSGRNLLNRVNLVREGHQNDFDDVGLVIDGPVSGLQMHASTSYVRHDFTSRYDASAALSLFDAPEADFGAYDETVNSELLSQDVYLSTPRSLPVSGLLGASFTQLTSGTPSSLLARVSGVTKPQLLYSEARTDKLTEDAVYGEVTLRLQPHWTLTVDGRLFNSSVQVHATTQAPRQAVKLRQTSVHSSEEAFSPKVSLQYELNNNTNIYALVSRGDRPGGFNTGGLQAPTLARRSYYPDRLFNYEAGLKTSLWQGRGDLQATIFYDRWRHVQTDQFYSSGLPYTANVGDGRLTGVEAEASWRPLPPLKLDANLIFTTSKIVNPATGFAAGLRDGLPGAPQAALAASGVWDQPLPWRGWDLQLTARTGYLGHTRLTFNQTTANTTSSAVFNTDLSAQLYVSRYRITLNLRNPEDSLANTFAYGNPFSFGQVRQVTPQRPRTIELIASARF